MTPGNNPEDFKQHYDHGGSLQLQVSVFLSDCLFVYVRDEINSLPEDRDIMKCENKVMFI
jgi:hypothetical protein